MTDETNTDREIKDFVKSPGFQTLSARQEQGFRFGFNSKTACPDLEVCEVDCNPVLARGISIIPGFATSTEGRPIYRLDGSSDLVWNLFSMRDGAQFNLDRLETDEQIKRTSGTWEIRDQRIAERNRQKDELLRTLQTVSRTIIGIANNAYDFRKMEVCENAYDRK